MTTPDPAEFAEQIADGLTALADQAEVDALLGQRRGGA